MSKEYVYIEADVTKITKEDLELTEKQIKRWSTPGYFDHQWFRDKEEERIIDGKT